MDYKLKHEDSDEIKKAYTMDCGKNTLFDDLCNYRDEVNQSPLANNLGK